MNIRLCVRQALTVCSVTAVLLTYSLVALAGPGKAVGELTISGGTRGDSAQVTVNGEPAQSGRTVLASSTISVPEGATATLSFGKAGRVQFGPNTTFVLGSDQDSINGSLTSGSVTVLSSAKSVGVRTLAGKVVELNAGETATAEASTASRHNNYAGNDWAIWVIIFGGALAAIIWAATSDNNRVALGGGTTVVSPIR